MVMAWVDADSYDDQDGAVLNRSKTRAWCVEGERDHQGEAFARYDDFEITRDGRYRLEIEATAFETDSIAARLTRKRGPEVEKREVATRDANGARDAEEWRLFAVSAPLSAGRVSVAVELRPGVRIRRLRFVPI